MNEEMTQWASGMTLGWAIFSLALGALIILVVVIRLWGDYRRKEPEEGRE